MSIAADMAKASVKGGFHVMWGQFASTIISAVGAIILAKVLGESNYGLYAVALTTPTLIALFQDLGINYAVIRYAARLNAENRPGEIGSILISGLIFKCLFGLALSIFCLLLSPYLAISVFHRPLITTLIQIVSFTILAQALVTTATAAFTGVEKMQLNSIMVVSQAAIKTSLAPALVLLGFGLSGAITGYTIALLITAIIGLLLVWTIYKNLPNLPAHKLELTKNIRILLRFGLPLSFGDIIGGFLTQFYTFLLAVYVSNNALIGNYNLATNFIVIIGFFTTPIATMLLPAFSKLDADKDRTTLQTVYQMSVKYSTLIVMPVIAIMIALATPGIAIFFGHTYTGAPFDLSLLALNFAFIAVGFYSTNGLINSQEQASIKLTLALVTVAMGVPLGLITISRYGVLGMLVTLILDGVPSVIIGLIFINRRYNLTINWNTSAKVTLCSAAAGFISHFVVYLPILSVLQLVTGLAVFLTLFFVLIVLSRAITKTDLDSLREMTSGLGPLGKLVKALMAILEKLMAAAHNTQNSQNQFLTKNY